MDDELKILRKNLADLGLGKTEQEVFIVLTEWESPQTTYNIALQLEMPRQTVQSAIRKLVKKGILAETIVNRIPEFFTNRKIVGSYVDDLCSRLQEMKRQIFTQLN